MKRILLAEDDLDDQQIFSEVIEEINQSIDLAIVSDGEQVLTALERMAKSNALPDLVILDQNMPRLKGSEAIRLIRENPKYDRVSTVIYSTYHDSRFIENCKKLGIELFLKPDTYEDLRKLIAKMINMYGKSN